MAETTREIRLASRPDGAPVPENFELAEVELPEVGEGEALVRNSYLSVDPYMRGRMRDVKSYIPPFQVGDVLQGGAVGQVVASRSDAIEEGSWVLSLQGWRERYLSNGDGLLTVDPSLAPVSTALGVLGMPGLTAYVGLTEFGRPREGETVFVSAAAGAVGSVVGQLARIRGARTVGSAGSQEKVDFLTQELGFDAAFNYKAEDLSNALREHCPQGIDVYFDNVGGDHLEAALGRMNGFGRIPLCGMVSLYNLEEPPPGPRNMAAMVVSRVTMRGFIVTDHYDLYPRFVEEVSGYVDSGEMKYRETVVDGIERMPEAFIGLLEGENIGKMLVRVDPDAS
ncbi:MAG: NADP-dependent oxidoreductase [Actinomycetota bacterium]|nr:NADP-dependent oxidoreductase [Actinomycetota bacterium]